MAGIIYMLGEYRYDIAALDLDMIHLMDDFANAAGSIATTKRGAIPAMSDLCEANECIKTMHKL